MHCVTIEEVKSFATAAGALGSFFVFLLALLTYRRTEKWKRAEFIANEMKDFFGTPRVEKALTLIDWGYRTIKLIEDVPDGKALVRVTRMMQTMALRPHVLLDPAGSDTEVFAVVEGGSLAGFDQSEVAIRYCYDAFLDGLERFGNYSRADLTDVASLRPYIGYWIDEIASLTEDPDDASWCAALLTYIAFYRYDGVLWLFDAFGYDIRPSSSVYMSFLRLMEKQGLASQLARTVNCDYQPAVK